MHIYIYDVAIELVSRDVCSLSPHIIYLYNNICMFVSVGDGGVYIDAIELACLEICLKPESPAVASISI